MTTAITIVGLIIGTSLLFWLGKLLKIKQSESSVEGSAESKTESKSTQDRQKGVENNQLLTAKIQSEIARQYDFHRSKYEHEYRAIFARIEKEVHTFKYSIPKTADELAEKIKKNITSQIRNKLNNQGFFERLTSGFPIEEYINKEIGPQILEAYNQQRDAMISSFHHRLKNNCGIDDITQTCRPANERHFSNAEMPLEEKIKNGLRGGAIGLGAAGAGYAIAGAFPPLAFVGIPVLAIALYETDESLETKITQTTDKQIIDLFCGDGIKLDSGQKIDSIVSGCNDYIEKCMHIINLQGNESKEKYMAALKRARNNLELEVNEEGFRNNYQQSISNAFSKVF